MRERKQKKREKRKKVRKDEVRWERGWKDGRKATQMNQECLTKQKKKRGKNESRRRKCIISERSRKKNKEEERRKERTAAMQVCFSQQIESLPSAFSAFSHIRSVLLHITIRPPLSPINPPGNSLHFFLFLFFFLPFPGLKC